MSREPREVHMPMHIPWRNLASIRIGILPAKTMQTQPMMSGNMLSRLANRRPYLDIIEGTMKLPRIKEKPGRAAEIYHKYILNTRDTNPTISYVLGI